MVTLIILLNLVIAVGFLIAPKHTSITKDRAKVLAFWSIFIGVLILFIIFVSWMTEKEDKEIW